MGEDKIYELVLVILNALANEENNDASIADKFGLSKATFSRFAGRDWKRGGILDIPDLWENMAKVVTSDPVFEEFAMENGVMEIIDIVLEIKEMRS